MEATKDYGTRVYHPEADQMAVFGWCPPIANAGQAPAAFSLLAILDIFPNINSVALTYNLPYYSKAAPLEQGKLYNCRLTFFTFRLGVLFHYLTYRDVVISGSDLLGSLVARFQGDGLNSQACDVSPIETIIQTELFDGHDWIVWVLHFLHLAYDYPDVIAFPDALKPVLSPDRGVSELIDLHTVAVFFGIYRLQQLANALVDDYLAAVLKNCFLVSSEGSMGSAQFRQYNMTSQLRHAADAILRAAPIVPQHSYVWILVARYFLAMRQVLDGTDSGEDARHIIARLNPIAPFAHAYLEESLNIRPASLVGVFRSPVDWKTHGEVCACTGCSNDIFARDLLAQRTDGLAGGATQKYALVNPFDGYRTLLCDYCRQRCGVPWAGGNTPCIPHE